MDLNYGSPPLVNADKDQLSRVFSNLILNAVQAMQPQGTLSVSTELDSGNVDIRISDTGSGISQENLKHIFDPFFTTKHYGTGLGLAIVHSIIVSHKGSIEFSSSEGKGTTVHISLPAT